MRLSGLTLPPSQADSSVAAWLDLLAGSPAKTSALPADRQESMESGADCSLKSSDSFASWSPSSGCFLRTSRQFSIFQQEQPFLENLPRSGSMRNGELYERPMLVDRTGESGRLCWPTARSQDSKHGEATDYEMSREEGLDLLHVKVERMMRTNWHTPSTEDHKSDGPNAQGRYGTEKMKTLDQRLRNQVWNWPSPRSEDLESCGNHPGAVDSLTGAARMWHTPKAHENAETSGTFVSRNADRGAHCFSGLGAQTINWPTPATRDWKSGEASEETLNRNARPLSEIASHFSLPAPPTLTHGGKFLSGSTRRLNPEFVDWLMGLIPGWTDYAPLATALYLPKLRSLLRFYLGGRAE